MDRGRNGLDRSLPPSQRNPRETSENLSAGMRVTLGSPSNVDPNPGYDVDHVLRTDWPNELVDVVVVLPPSSDFQRVSDAVR